MTTLIAFLVNVLIVNVLIATAKTIAAVLTSAASMAAEAVHSWTDAATRCPCSSRTAAGSG